MLLHNGHAHISHLIENIFKRCIFYNTGCAGSIVTNHDCVIIRSKEHSHGTNVKNVTF